MSESRIKRVVLRQRPPLPGFVPCPACMGTGHDLRRLQWVSRCEVCRGVGQIRQRPGIIKVGR